ncbi:MAG: Holliday junction branch migration protein RuvA [Gammaproteobacteria bacterium TMED119]|nr:MAG: Holliday junction branch migration protein RuvA [Gammaproteobacteria bacterium TMED119]RCL45395.1 MAG: Holliday junction branch migration protein RuvA [Candidatus Thioglobus sp.]|tara:strand:- start:1196 stop:1792 length:597 start_codon:yes stop_codon:yes gene_type:complete
MIGRLRGILLSKQAPALMLEVAGVGYELEAPMSTFYELPECGQEVTLFTHFSVREDAQTLYGFHSTADRTLFRTLLKVNGVGARMALTILSGMDAHGFKQCIQLADTEALVKLPGVGKKTAERLVVELRDRLAGDQTSAGSATMAAAAGPDHALDEAISALIALGYKSTDAIKMVKNVQDQAQRCEDLIRLALKTSLS